MQLVKKIDPELIFSKLEDYDIFKYYLGDFIIGSTFQGPFEHQSSPSFGVYYKDKKLFYSDFSNPDIHGDCVQLVQQLFQLSYEKALSKIARDFQLTSGKDDYKRIVKEYVKPVMQEKRYCLIQVTAKKMTAADIKYWAQYGIDQEDTRREEIYSVREWYLNRKKQVQGKDELCYAYRYKEGFQIYMPERKKGDKWKSNMPLTYIEGWDKVDSEDSVLITKSKKDKIYLQKLLSIPVMRTINESMAAYTDEVVNKLRTKKNVWINYDADESGKKASWKITSLLNCKHLNTPDKYLPEITDYTDWRKEDGNDKRIIKHLKQKGVI